MYSFNHLNFTTLLIPTNDTRKEKKKSLFSHIYIYIYIYKISAQSSMPTCSMDGTEKHHFLRMIIIKIVF
jgi:hypothetical protein